MEPKYGSSLPKAAQLQGFYDFVDIVKRKMFPLWCGLAGIRGSFGRCSRCSVGERDRSRIGRSCAVTCSLNRLIASERQLSVGRLSPFAPRESSHRAAQARQYGALRARQEERKFLQRRVHQSAKARDRNTV